MRNLEWQQYNETFGHAVADLRARHRMTQEDLAFRSGLHRTYISFLERGLKSPSLGVIITLARALETSPAFLVEVTEDGRSP